MSFIRYTYLFALLSGWLASAGALAQLSDKMSTLLQQGVMRYAEVEIRVRQEQVQKSAAPEDNRYIEARTYAELGKELGTDPQMLREKLPQAANELKRAPDATNYERANAAYVAKDYIQAEQLALAVANQAQRATPPRDPDALKAFELAGSSAQSRGENAYALEHYRAAEPLTDPARNLSEWAALQGHIAFTYLDQKKYADAETVWRNVITRQQRALDPEDKDLIYSRACLAVTLLSQHNFREGMPECQAVLKLQEKVLGRENPSTLAIRNLLAAALVAQDDVVEGVAQFRKVIALREKVLGPEAPETIDSRMDLAASLEGQGLGKFAEAEKEYRKIIRLKQKTLGPKHPDTIRVFSLMAVTLERPDNYNRAEKEIREGLKLQQEILGPEDPATLETSAALVNVLVGQGRLVEAEKRIRELLKVQEKVLGPQHPDTLLSYLVLAGCLAKENKMDVAQEFARRAIEADPQTFGPVWKQFLASLRAKK
jgi:tetratricopeptide (TPR) repeat protein